MDISKLILICDIAKTNNLTLSAERMGYTQSGVSHSIKKIEDEMGITFFKRMKNGVQLTYEGRTLMPYISSIVKSYNMQLYLKHNLYLKNIEKIFQFQPLKNTPLFPMNQT